MARGNVRVRITADADGVKRGVRESEQQLGRLQSVSRRASGGIGVAFKAAGGVIAGAAIADQIAATVKAAQDAEVSQKRLQTQLRASGISYRAHAAEIDKVIQKTSQLSGLDDEDLQDSFTNIVRVTGDVNKSLRLTGLAADFARAKHIDVAKAGEIVAKVAGGNTGILSRYGIQIEKGASATEALGVLQQKFAGQAEAYGKTSAGAQDRFRVAVENLQESIGAKLLPTLTKVTNAVATFVNGMQTGSGAGGRFADKMRQVGKDVGDAVRAMADVFRAVSPAVREMAQGVLKRFEALGEGIRGAAKIISGILHGDFGKAWDGVKLLFRAQVKQVVGILQTSTAPFRKAGEAIGKAVYNGISAGFRSVVGFMEDRLNDVIGVINSAIRVFNKLPGPDIREIDKIGGGGGGGPSRSEIVRAIPNSSTAVTGRGNTPHGTNPTGRSNFIARIASTASSPVMARAARTGDATAIMAAAQAAGVPPAYLWAVYGAESSWGKADNSFGILSRPRSGSFGGDARISANALAHWATVFGGDWERVFRKYSGGDYGLAHIQKVLRTRGLPGGGGAATRRPTSSYPLATRGAVIGTPNAGTHTLGNWQSDNAVDIRVERGTPVLAVEDGTITKVVERPDGAGRFAGSQITLHGRSGNSYFYTHLSAVSVSVGEQVAAGEQIGASGVANGVPHLHFGQQRGDPRNTIQRQIATVAGVAAGQRPKKSKPKRKRPPNLLGRVLDSAPSPVFGTTGEFTANEPEGPSATPGEISLANVERDLNMVDLLLAAGRINEADAKAGRDRILGQALGGTYGPLSLESRLGLEARVKELKDAVDTTNDLLQQQLDRTNELLALERQKTVDTQRALNTSQSEYSVLTRALAAIVGGELGGKLGLGWSTPGYAGAGARY